jgi:hypothetical protein
MQGPETMRRGRIFSAITDTHLRKVRLEWGLALPIAIYLGLVLSHIGAILANIQSFADATSAQVIGEFLGERDASGVLLGGSWYSVLVFERLTRWVPDHRALWDLTPFLTAAIAIALMGWAAAQVAGRRAGLLTLALLICASPVMLQQEAWIIDHMTCCYSLALLAALLVWLQTRGGSVGQPFTAVAVLVVGVVVGIGMASEKLLEITGPGPLLVSSVATWRAYPSRKTAQAAGWTLAVVAVSVVVALVVTSIMRGARVYQIPVTITFASADLISTNVKDWWVALVALGNGSFFEQTLSFASVLYLVCGVLTLLGVVQLPRLARWSFDRRRTEFASGPLSAYLGFWALSAATLSVAFIVSTASKVGNSQLFLSGIIFAVAATIPVYAKCGERARLVVLAGITVFALTSTIAVLRGGSLREITTGPTRRVALQVADAAERLGVTHGFAGYWDASPLTWSSHSRVKIAPYYACANKMCPGPVNLIGSWYTLSPGERTFLLIDPGHALSLPAPPPELGPASRVDHLGKLTMYVYDYNIALYMR